MPGLSIHRLTDAHLPRLAEIEALYREAFPASERKPVGFLRAALDRPDYALFCAESARRFAGMALVYRSHALGFALLEYLAVPSLDRGSGHGGEMLADVASRLDCPVAVEVESEGPGHPGDDTRRRRGNFYRRHGYMAVEGLAYLMPQVSGELPPPMDLMIRGFPGSAMPRATLRAWLEDIYVHVYGRGADDPAIPTMLKPISDAAALV